MSTVPPTPPTVDPMLPPCGCMARLRAGIEIPEWRRRMWEAVGGEIPVYTPRIHREARVAEPGRTAFSEDVLHGNPNGLPVPRRLALAGALAEHYNQPGLTARGICFDWAMGAMPLAILASDAEVFRCELHRGVPA